MTRQASYSPAERRKFARQALQEGVDKIAGKAGRKPETIRRWMQEAGLSSDNASGSPMSGGGTAADALSNALNPIFSDTTGNTPEAANRDPARRGTPMERNEAFVGADVEFGYGDVKTGKVRKLNPQKAVVILADGTGWRVGYTSLRHARNPAEIPDFDPNPVARQIPDGIKIGDEVEFGRGTVRRGVVHKLNPTRAVVHLSNGELWNVPYPNIRTGDGPLADVPAPPVSAASDVNVGDRVRFGRPNGQQHYGIVNRINVKSIAITEEGTDLGFRVSPGLVHPA